MRAAVAGVQSRSFRNRSPLSRAAACLRIIRSAPLGQTGGRHAVGQGACKSDGNQRLPYCRPGKSRRYHARGLTPEQAEHLEKLTDQYVRRTKTSKELARRNRPVLADSRLPPGFATQPKRCFILSSLTDREALASGMSMATNTSTLPWDLALISSGTTPIYSQTLRDQLDKGIDWGHKRGWPDRRRSLSPT